MDNEVQEVYLCDMFATLYRNKNNNCLYINTVDAR